MRKNETPPDPELCHVCLSLKNRLFPNTGAVRHHVHTKYSGNVKKCQIFHSEPCMEGEWRLYSCHLTCLGMTGPSSHQPLTGTVAIPCTVRLMVLWSHAANFSLSRNNPLHWQMSGIWLDVPLIQPVYTWMVPANQGPLGEMVRDLDQFLLSKHEIRIMFSWGHEFVICLLNAVALHTNRMGTC